MPFWLNATGTPGEIAARAGDCVRVLPHADTHCTGGREDLIGQQIEDTLDPDFSTSPYRGSLIELFELLFDSYEFAWHAARSSAALLWVAFRPA